MVSHPRHVRPMINHASLLSRSTVLSPRREGARDCSPGIMHGCSLLDDRPLNPYYAMTEHVGFSSTSQTSRAPCAYRPEVFGESHEGWAVSYQEPLVRRISVSGSDEVLVGCLP